MNEVEKKEEKVYGEYVDIEFIFFCFGLACFWVLGFFYGVVLFKRFCSFRFGFIICFGSVVRVFRGF